MSHHILVVRLSSLGDVVLTGPVYKNLKAHWPDCRVVVLVKPQFASVLRGHPDIDEVMIFHGVVDAVKRIKAGGFTHLLDLQGTLRSWLIRRLSGVPSQAVYRKDALERRLFVAFGLTSPTLQRHTVERYLEALSVWGVPSPLRRVVVLQTSFLGDSLLTLPLLRRLKESLPGASLAVVTLPKHAEVFSGCPWVDEVVLDDKRGAHAGLAGLWRLVALLRRRDFELAVVPHRSLRSALAAWLAGIPRRIGFTASAGRFLMTDLVPFSWLTHDLERNLALARPLGGSDAVSPASSKYVAATPPGPELARCLQAAGIADSDRLVGVHPGAAWATKRWSQRRFGELCRRLAHAGFKPVLVGGPEDTRLGSGISEASGAVDLTGKTRLSDLRALMGRFSLFVTNDSGPMHLAAAAGVPVVAVFGATTRELGFFPYGLEHRVVEAPLACRPCGLHGASECPQGHFLCMKLVTVDQVWQACRASLDAGVAA